MQFVGAESDLVAGSKSSCAASLSNLPVETLLIIAEFMDMKTLFQFRISSKMMEKLLQSQVMDIILCPKHYGSLIHIPTRKIPKQACKKDWLLLFGRDTITVDLFGSSRVLQLNEVIIHDDAAENSESNPPATEMFL